MSDSSSPDSSRNVGRSWSPYARSSATIWVHRLAICERMFSSTNVWACLSRTICEPDGRNGKPSATWRSTPRRVAPVKARNRSLKRNLAVIADEVQYGEDRLVWGPAQSASQLLKKDCGTLRRTEEQDRV